MTVSPAMWVTGNMASNMSLKERNRQRMVVTDTSELLPQMQKVYILQIAACFVHSFFFGYKLEKNITEITVLSGLNLSQTPDFRLEVFSLI